MILLIYGAGGLAKEIYDIVIRNNDGCYEDIVFIDDFAEEADFYFSRSIHFESAMKQFGNRVESLRGIVAVGEPQSRELLSKRFDCAGIKLATIIDSTTIVSPSARIEEGSILCEFTTIHADVHIGRSVLIQPFTNIGHDISIGDYSVISTGSTPGGSSTIGKKVYIGMNASSKEKICIADEAILGMGASVFRDVENSATLVGNPARITKGNEEHKVFK